MPELVLTGVRWSGLAWSRCARRVWFEHTDAPRDEPSDETRDLWRRGHRFEQIVADEVLNELAQNGIDGDRQVVVDWPDPDDPIGQTHADLTAPVGGAIRILEVKSNAGAELQENAALQVSGQAVAISRQTSVLNGELAHEVDAFVVAVDSHTGKRRDHRVEWEHYEPEVERLWLLARDAVNADAMPDRVAEFPGDSRCRWCPFRGPCWAEWEPPEPDQVLGLDDIAGELAQLDADIKLHGERGKALLERRDQLRDALRPHLPANELVGLGSVRIKRTVYPATTFALGEATTAGLALPSEFDTYVKTSEREKWTVKA